MPADHGLSKLVLLTAVLPHANRDRHRHSDALFLQAKKSFKFCQNFQDPVKQGTLLWLGHMVALLRAVV